MHVRALRMIAQTTYILPMALSPILRLFLKSRDLKEFITSQKIHSTEVLTLLIFLLYNSIAGINALAPALNGACKCALSG